MPAPRIVVRKRGVVSFSEGNNPCTKRGSWVGAGHCVPSNSSRDLSRSLPSLDIVQGSRLRRSNTLTLSRERRGYICTFRFDLLPPLVGFSVLLCALLQSMRASMCVGVSSRARRHD